MSNASHHAVAEGGTGTTAVSSAGMPAADDARLALAKLELRDLERKQARWALARGIPSVRSPSSWGPGLLMVLIYFIGVWIADSYIDRGDAVTRYLAYVVSMLTGVVFFLGWTLRTLNRRMGAVMEIIEQQK